MSRVLIVGDVMLDEFIYGDVNRISPEAPTPVLSVGHTDIMIGGAGNVARGVAALDCECDLVGVIGPDHHGKALMREFHALDRIIPWLSIDMERVTTRKTRFVSKQQHLLRVDAESIEPVSGRIETVMMKQALLNIAADSDLRVVVLSDYCKGALTPHMIQTIIDHATARQRHVVIDSKRKDLSPYRGAAFVKLNLAELGAHDGDAETEIEHRARKLMREHKFGAVIVTRGENGLSVFMTYAGTFHIPGRRVRVRDVSGAGDTIVAAFAVGLATGMDVIPALERANEAASIAVGKPGTAAVSLAELSGTKIADGTSTLLDQRLAEWRGLRIGFTNGCFDILHPGHVKLLEQARSHCDRLIVGLNSDASVRHNKGPGRPVQSVEDRAAVLAALDSVDLVVIFNAPTPIDLVERIRPDVLVKGGDYKPEDIAGREYATKVVSVPRTGMSTTQIIERAADANTGLDRAGRWDDGEIREH